MTALEVSDDPKMLRETLCTAQHAVLSLNPARRDEHVARLQRAIDACDVHRPLGPDGKHGERHTPTCGCDDAEFALRCTLSAWLTLALTASRPDSSLDGDLLALRDWVDSGCVGDAPMPD